MADFAQRYDHRVVVDFLHDRSEGSAPLAILIVLYKPKDFDEMFEQFANPARDAAADRQSEGTRRSPPPATAADEGVVQPGSEDT